MAPRDPGSYQRIYAAVRRIPRGRVATYGQIASLAGLPGHARQVGYALHALPDASRVPWHRVINAQGRVSPRAAPGWDDVQRQLLAREGVRFGSDGRLSLSRYQWRPRAASTG
jgi:methylated-DNA-protein-cysteine methyltransferase-like protein